MEKIIKIHKLFKMYETVGEHIPRTFCILLSWIFSILVVFSSNEPDSITSGCTCLAFSLPILLEYYFKLNKTIHWIIRLFYTFFVLISFILCAISISVIIKIIEIDCVCQWMFCLSTLIVVPFLLDCIFLMVFEKMLLQDETYEKKEN